MKKLRYIFILTFFAFGFAVWPAYAQNQGESERVLDIQVVESESGGMTAWLVEDHSVPVIAVDFFFKPEGQLYDEATQGITYFLSTMLDEGAGDYDSQAFQRMLEDYNISLSFSGGRDSFGGNLYMLTKYQDKGWEALRLALTQPRFDAEPLERMRRAVITSARRRMGNPGWVGARLLNHYMYPDHYYALNSGGTLSNLERFSADDLRQFVRDHFAKDTLHVAVAGDITADELAVQLAEVFGGLPAQSRNETDFGMASFPEDAANVVFEKDLPQTFLELAWPSVDPHSDDYPALIVMNYIWGGGGFSSRLMSEIREKRGLTYGIYSSVRNFDKAYRLLVSTSTAHDNLDDMRRIIREEAEKMIYEDVTDEELERAKNYLTGSLVLAFTNTQSIAGGVSGLLYNDRPIDYLDQYSARIRAVSKADIREVARKIFHDIEPVEVFVGQKPAGLEEQFVTRPEDVPNTQ